MKVKFFGGQKPASKGPFLLSKVTETPKKNVIAKLLEEKDQNMMEAALMALYTELAFKLVRKNGAKCRPNPFTYEYDLNTLCFTVKPIDVTADVIIDDLRYFLPPDAPESNNAPPSPK